MVEASGDLHRNTRLGSLAIFLFCTRVTYDAPAAATIINIMFFFILENCRGSGFGSSEERSFERNGVFHLFGGDGGTVCTLFTSSCCMVMSEENVRCSLGRRWWWWSSSSSLVSWWLMVSIVWETIGPSWSNATTKMLLVLWLVTCRVIGSISVLGN